MAGNDESDDPFHWDEARIIQELCTSERSWNPSDPNGMPDSQVLANRLEEFGVNGQALLSYQDVFGPSKISEDLGLRKFRHRLYVQEAIKQFKTRSRGYQAWKQAQEKDQWTEKSHRLGAGDAVSPEPGSHNNSVPLSPAPKAQRPMVSGQASTLCDDVSVVPSERNEGSIVPTSGDLHVGGNPQEGPPRKKKRITPLAIGKPTHHPGLHHIPNEGDTFMAGTVESILAVPGQKEEYLGSATLIPGSILELSASNVGGAEARVFTWLAPRHFAPGRRIQISQAIKRFLQSDGRTLEDGDTDPEDEVLPLYDPEEEFDPETLRQMHLDEEEDREARERSQARFLSESEVIDLVQRAIEEFEARWIEEKKSKLERKANKIWNSAQRNNACRLQINQKLRSIGHLDRRIKKLTDAIREEKWQRREDVQRQASSLEETVFCRQHDLWLVDLLRSRSEPPKPSALPRPQQVKKKEVVRYEEDEEILSSESDGDDNFVVDDRQRADASDFGDIPLDDGPDMTLDSVDFDASTEHPMPTVDDLDNEPSLAGSEIEEERKFKMDIDIPSTPKRPAHTAVDIIEIKSSSPPPPNIDQIPGLQEPEKLAEIGPVYWQNHKDRERLVVCALQEWPGQRRALFDAVEDCEPQQLWDSLMMRPGILGPKKEALTAAPDTNEAERDVVAFALARLFDAYVSCSAQRINLKHLSERTVNNLRAKEAEFPKFCRFMKSVIPYFPPETARTPTPIRALKLSLRESQGKPSQRAASKPEDLAEEDIEPDSPADDMPISPTKKRRRRVLRDRAAENLRITNLERNKELGERRALLRERLAQSGSVPGDKSRLIINESKESDDQALIYVSENIGGRIKDHQIEGVRFMWNQLVVDSKVRQGCLLAHTMGLGKTMQVITLLVAIAEASSSPDPSVYSQIPHDLRESKTLVLCPSGLVNNWIDELLIWAPDNLLGELAKVDASLNQAERVGVINRWAAVGGVLVMGYPLFSKLVKQEDTAKVLHDTPNIVVGDEAHNLKNPQTQIHQATSKFRTMSRIAMTGSPLTNNVMDYYAMINWVAPNYLANIAEFRQTYENPIKEGLYADSKPWDKRKALKLLSVLKATVAPKVHRMGISALAGELPLKREFIISITLTDVQMKVYKAYVKHMMENPKVQAQMSGQSQVWSFVNVLSTLLAHPYVFRKRLLDRKKEKAKHEKTWKDLDEEEVDMPEDLISEILSLVPGRDVMNYELSHKITILGQILDESRRAGDKVLVFSQSIPTLDYLAELFARQKRIFFRLDGTTPVGERQGAIKKFNMDDTAEVYLISTKAGGVGLNICGANRVVIFDFRYTPAQEQQAVGRAYRIGQSKPVYVYWLICGGTFEKTIQNKSVFKMQLASRVVDKKNPIAWSQRLGNYFAIPTDPEQEDLSAMLGQDSVLDALLRSDALTGVIRQITSTDTFEEEEEEVLTSDEEKEITDLIAREKLRIQDPAEYKLQEQQRLAALYSHQPQPSLPQPSFPQMLQMPRMLQMPQMPQTPQMPSEGYRQSQLMPPHMRTSARPSSLSAPTPLPPLSGTTLQPPTGSVTNPAQRLFKVLPSSVGQQATSALQQSANLAKPRPTASHDILSKSPPGSSEAITLRSPRQNGTNPQISPGNTATDTRVEDRAVRNRVEEKSAKLREELTSIHDRLKEEGRMVTMSPSTAITGISDVYASSGIAELPKIDKFQTLIQTIHQSPRFGEALMAEHVEPAEVAEMPPATLKAKAEELDRLSEDQFKERVWKHQDPSHLRKNMRRSLSRPGHTARGSGDMEVMQQVLSRRARRNAGTAKKPRLPQWAYRELDRHRDPSTPKPSHQQRPGDSAESPHVIE